MNNSKKRKLLIISILFIIYLLFSVFAYIDFSKKLEKHDREMFSIISTIQDISLKFHNQNSDLYKNLFLENSNVSFSENSNLIANLLKLKENNLFSPEKLAMRIDEYYSLEKLKKKILEVNENRLLNIQEINKNSSYLNISQENKEIFQMIDDFERQVNLLINSINNDIEVSKARNQDFIKKMKFDFIRNQLIISIFFLLIILYLLWPLNLFKKNDFENQDNEIIDSTSNKIINYVKNQINMGNFPTIKEIKIELKLSHPTILSKLKELEEKKLISIKKKGRNKYIYLLNKE